MVMLLLVHCDDDDDDDDDYGDPPCTTLMPTRPQSHGCGSVCPGGHDAAMTMVRDADSAKTLLQNTCRTP